MQVLVIDDDQINAPQMARILSERFKREATPCNCLWVDSLALGRLRLEESPLYEVVLVDIKDICVPATKEVIANAVQLLRRARPYIPVIAISEYQDAAFIMAMWNAGATGYIFKSELHLGIKATTPQEAAAFEEDWRTIRSKILDAAQQYATIRRRLQPRVVGVFKKYGHCSESIIGQQRAFLEKVRECKHLRTHFPEVTDYGQTSNICYYTTPRYWMRSLRKLIFETLEQQECLENAQTVLAPVMEFIFRDLCPTEVTEASADYVSKVYFEKFRKRIEQTKKLLKSRKDALASVVSAMLGAKEIKIGGKSQLSPTEILSMLKADRKFLRSMKPPKLFMIHGDLHFSNMLADATFPQSVVFILIDPRGDPLGGDIAYDIGKLLHSSDGKYDFIHEGYLRCTTPDIRHTQTSFETPDLRFEPWEKKIEEGGGSGAETVSTIATVSEKHLDVFNSLTNYILHFCENEKLLEADGTWLMRTKFNEAMHFCTMAPFHIRDLSLVLSILIRGVELMNEFYAEYTKGKYQTS